MGMLLAFRVLNRMPKKEHKQTNPRWQKPKFSNKYWTFNEPNPNENLGFFTYEPPTIILNNRNPPHSLNKFQP